MKRVLAVLMTLVMVLGMFPVSAMASDSGITVEVGEDTGIVVETPDAAPDVGVSVDDGSSVTVSSGASIVTVYAPVTADVTATFHFDYYIQNGLTGELTQSSFDLMSGACYTLGPVNAGDVWSVVLSGPEGYEFDQTEWNGVMGDTEVVITPNVLNVAVAQETTAFSSLQLNRAVVQSEDGSLRLQYTVQFDDPNEMAYVQSHGLTAVFGGLTLDADAEFTQMWNYTEARAADMEVMDDSAWENLILPGLLALPEDVLAQYDDAVIYAMPDGEAVILPAEFTFVMNASEDMTAEQLEAIPVPVFLVDGEAVFANTVGDWQGLGFLPAAANISLEPNNGFVLDLGDVDVPDEVEETDSVLEAEPETLLIKTPDVDDLSAAFVFTYTLTGAEAASETVVLGSNDSFVIGPVTSGTEWAVVLADMPGYTFAQTEWSGVIDDTGLMIEPEVLSRPELRVRVVYSEAEYRHLSDDSGTNASRILSYRVSGANEPTFNAIANNGLMMAFHDSFSYEGVSAGDYIDKTDEIWSITDLRYRNDFVMAIPFGAENVAHDEVWFHAGERKVPSGVYDANEILPVAIFVNGQYAAVEASSSEFNTIANWGISPIISLHGSFSSSLTNTGKTWTGYNMGSGNAHSGTYLYQVEGPQFDGVDIVQTDLEGKDQYMAYCVQPGCEAPNNYTGDVYEANHGDELGQLFCKFMYYGYDGPGYQKGKLPSLSSSDDLRFEITHLALSDALWNMQAGCGVNGGAFTNDNGFNYSWIPLDEYGQPYHTENKNNDAYKFYEWCRDEAPAVPGGFHAYIIENVAADGQSLAFCTYNPSTAIQILKVINAEYGTYDDNSNYSLDGTVFHMYTDASCTKEAVHSDTGEPVGDIVITDGQSPVIFNIEPGTYYLRETQAPSSFKLNTTTYRVDALEGRGEDNPYKVTADNKPVQVLLDLFKKDNKNEPVVGARYRVEWYGSGSTVLFSEELRTNNDGHAIATKMGPFGKVRVYETYAPPLYVKNSCVYEFTVTADSVQGPSSSMVHVSGIADPNDTAATSTPPTYTIDTYGEDLRVKATVSETLIEGELVLQKYDDISGLTTPEGMATLAGAEFEIYEAGRTESELGPRVMTVTTDANGHASTGRVLKAGTYKVVESVPPEGYVKDDTVYTFSIGYDTGNKLVLSNTYNVYETPERGGFRAWKTDLYTDGVPEGDTSFEDCTFVVKYIGASSSGAGSAQPIYVKKDLTTFLKSGRVLADGKPVSGRNGAFAMFKPGEDVLEIKSAASGAIECTTDVLPVGTYSIRETDANSSHTGQLLHDGSEHYFVINRDGEHVDVGTQDRDTEKLHINNNPMLGGVQVQKNNANTSSSAQSGNTDYAGIKFVIKNRSANRVSVEGDVWTDGDSEGALIDGRAVYEPGQDVYIIVTGADGIAKITKNAGKVLPYGTYEIREVRQDWTPRSEGSSKMANDYYFYDSKNVQTFQIREDGVTVMPDQHFIENDEIHGGVQVRKDDSRLNVQGKTQGDGSLAGIKFVVTNKSKNAVYINEAQYTGAAGTHGTVGGVKSYAPNEDCYVIVTDENGIATSALRALPYGEYEVREVRKDWTPGNEGTSIYANDSYLYTAQSHSFRVLLDNKLVILTEKDNMPPNGDGKWLPVNDIVRGGVNIEKRDKDTSESNPQGDGVLSGTEFTITNKSQLPVYIDVDGDGTEEEYKPDAVITVLVTDAEGKASLPNDFLPYGTYEIQETKQSTGYMLTDGQPRTFSIRTKGQVQQYTAAMKPDAAFYNYVIRGGVQIRKDDDRLNVQGKTQGDGSLAGITFVIRNISNNPVYMRDGKLGTAGYLNAGSIDGAKKYAPGTDCYAIVTGTDGLATTALDALPYGTYEIREVRKDWAPGKTDEQCTSIYANASYLYDAENVHTFKILEDSKIVELQKTDNMGGSAIFSNAIIRGGLDIEKRDVVSRASEPEGDAALLNTEFTIKNSSNLPVFIDVDGDGTEEEYAVGAIITTLHTDIYGKTSLPNDFFPYGTYTVQEVKSSTGYVITDGTPRIFQIRTDGQVYKYTGEAGSEGSTEGAFFNDTIRAGVTVNKLDARLMDTASSQGDASLAGIKFVVRNLSLMPVYVKADKWTGGPAMGMIKDADTNGYAKYDRNEDILVIVTNEAGVASTVATNILPYGTYSIREVRADWTPGSEGTSDCANDSYVYDANNSHEFCVRQDNVMIDLRSDDTNGGHWYADNEVARGGLYVEKRDAETRQRAAQGGATLAGTEFSIVNKSKQSVWIDVDMDGVEKEFAPGDTITVIRTNKDGIAELPANYLPYGTYEITETKASSGYHLTDDQPRTFRIRTDGEIVRFDGENSFFNKPIRADLEFEKIEDSTGRAMANIPFIIISQTTGEWHILVTDENGVVNTGASWNEHTYNTNINDERFDTEGKDWLVQPDVQAGIWFGTSAPDDSVGALLFDVYTIRELAYEPASGVGGNAGMLLYEDAFTINRDGHAWDGGTIRNRIAPKIYLWSDAEDSLGSKNVYAFEETTLYDEVEISSDQNIVGNNYVLEGMLIDKATAAPLEQDGEPIRVRQEVQARSNNFTVQQEFTFDATALNGHEVVVFERLWDGDYLAGQHVDLSDENQTVKIVAPWLDSFAYVGYPTEIVEDRTKEYVCGPDTTITDEVYLTGLIPGEEYTLISTIINDTYHGEVPSCAAFNGRTLEENKANGVAARIEEMMKDIFKDMGLGEYDPSHENGQTGMWFDLPSPLDLNALTRASVEYADVFSETAWLTTTFRATDEDETLSTVFEHLDTTNKQGHALRCFQILVYKGHIIATEVQGEYESETVRSDVPGIGTEATVNGSHEAVANKEIVLEDRVSFTNLIPGEEYTLTGVLMDKATGEPLLVNGKQVTSEATFVPESSNGFVVVEFTFDGSAVIGKDIVVFEDLYRDGMEVAVHADIEDLGQTVHFSNPEIHTQAHFEDDSQVSEPAGEIVIYDDVSYTNLVPGDEYTISGVWMDKATGEPFTINGTELTMSTTFTPEEPNGTVRLETTVDSKYLAGKTIVAFETLYRENVELAFHADIEDAGQTLEFTNPEIHTTATDNANGGHVAYPYDEITINDVVAYTGLVPGRIYHLKGTLMDKSTNAALLVDSKEVTSEMDFTPEEPDGTVTMTFTFNASALQGKTIVVFEDLLRDGKEVTVHHDIEDEDQTVDFPDAHTTATDAETGAHSSVPDEEVTINDEVFYTNLISGETYHVSGVLMDKATGEPLEIDGKQITAEKDFTPDKPNGSVILTFTFDGSALEGQTLVVFEDILKDNKQVAVHHDINDVDQSVDFPELHTTATDSETGDHVSNADEEVTINDEVWYHALVPGQTYHLEGTLMDKSTGKPLMDGDKEVTAELDFVPEEPNGSVTLSFTFNGSALAGGTLVAFEDLTQDGKHVATHADLNDVDQTIEFPDIHTTATDSETEDHVSNPDADVTIYDDVRYENLIPGLQYHISGKLMDKETGKPLMVDDAEVTAEADFTPEEPNGTVRLTFTFDGSALAGKTVVAFEDLYHNGKQVATHSDIDDEEQTVHFPELHTTATDATTGSHETTSDKSITIVDRVEYNNLVPGKEYHLVGKLMDQTTGEPFTVDGKEITSELDFTPEQASGSVDMTFTFLANALTQTTKVVVFESLYLNEKQVGTHSDITDEGQTVTIIPATPQTPDTPTPPAPNVETDDTPYTGDTNNPALWAALAGLAMLGIVTALIVIKRRRTGNR